MNLPFRLNVKSILQNPRKDDVYKFEHLIR